MRVRRLAQSDGNAGAGKGSVKDIQSHLRHLKADTKANEYMQELPESVGRMVDSMYEDLMYSQAGASADLRPNWMGSGICMNGRHEETRTPDLYRVKVAL